MTPAAFFASSPALLGAAAIAAPLLLALAAFALALRLRGSCCSAPAGAPGGTPASASSKAAAADPEVAAAAAALLLPVTMPLGPEEIRFAKSWRAHSVPSPFAAVQQAAINEQRRAVSERFAAKVLASRGGSGGSSSSDGSFVLTVHPEPQPCRWVL